MTTLTEGRHPGEAILSEANFHRSRDSITIPAGTGVVPAGTVLGEVQTFVNVYQTPQPYIH